MGSGCGAVGRAVASKTRHPRFEFYPIDGSIRSRSKSCLWLHIEKIECLWGTLITWMQHYLN